MVRSSMQKVRPNPLVRLSRLSAERRWLLVRAVFVVTAAAAAVALLPFRRAIRFGAITRHGAAQLDVGDCVWAVEAAARSLPWRTMCIEKGLAVQRLLRSSGVDAVLHYGARHGRDAGTLEAHVWVSVGSKIVIGGEEAKDFREIATFA
jgi:hypothetical protein